MTPRSAHDEVDVLLGRTQDVFGGAWESLDTHAEPCPDGQDGLIFAFGRLGPGSDADQLATRIPQVVALWTAAGHVAAVTTSTQGGIALTRVRSPATGAGPGGLYLSLEATAHGTTIDAQSRCVPGDPDEYNAAHPTGAPTG